MIFKTIADEANYYRDLVDYKLMGNGYIMVMLDGRSFSSMIKNKFKKPFDDDFVNMMNETAKYVCENVYGCVLAYVQSDEISLVIKDDGESDAFFGYRLCKLQSIIASIATSKMNQLMIYYNMQNHPSVNPGETIMQTQLLQFDCKCWNVPNKDKAFQWIIYRQNDCTRNSKQQVAQYYFSHKELLNHNVDEQITMVKNAFGVDWFEDYNDGVKYGRIIHKVDFKITTDNGVTVRKKWAINEAKHLQTDLEFREYIKALISGNDKIIALSQYFFDSILEI